SVAGEHHRELRLGARDVLRIGRAGTPLGLLLEEDEAASADPRVLRPGLEAQRPHAPGAGRFERGGAELAAGVGRDEAERARPAALTQLPAQEVLPLLFGCLLGHVAGSVGPRDTVGHPPEASILGTNGGMR